MISNRASSNHSAGLFDIAQGQTNQSVSMAPALPDEILVKIVKACVQPYSLRARRSSRQITEGAPKNPTATLPSSGKVYHYEGLPKIMNMLLVNAMFHQEIVNAVREAFSGSMVIDPEVSLAQLISNLLRNGDSIHGWLKYKIHSLELIGRGLNMYSIEQLLASDRIPELRLLSFVEGVPFNVPDNSVWQNMVTGNAVLYEAYTTTTYDNLLANEKAANLLQARRITLRWTEFNTDRDGKSGRVVGITFEGSPGKGEARQYDVVLKERWSFPQSELPREIQRCESDHKAQDEAGSVDDEDTEK